MEPTTATDLALLILRVVVGLTLAAHGWNKFTGGGKIPGTGRWFDSIGMRPGRLNAYLAASTEMGAGLLLAAGLLTSLAAAGVIGVMTVAGWTSHRTNGFSSSRKVGSTCSCRPPYPWRWPPWAPGPGRWTTPWVSPATWTA